jgi:hypothetical protein
MTSKKILEAVRHIYCLERMFTILFVEDVTDLSRFQQNNSHEIEAYVYLIHRWIFTRMSHMQ